ncbi:hypothetical protein DPMN_138089 [Dreissena polymorpha]|uniref:Uncharacterized protein n=1 Tax=Dreissena polymorpha TaxID=45954 RepID=A0A9D4G6N3_DREPO|nr:hypothetical protein DPMN_138089 [Dreissena polymorpha]
MRKIESRFCAKELPETSRAKFQQAAQMSAESLENWTDIMITLETATFRNLPEKHSMQEAICKGCFDKKAGNNACLERPKSMREAVDLLRHHQYVTQAVDSPRKAKSYAVNAEACEEHW